MVSRKRSKRVAGASARPIAIDLFSGAGGLSLGFEQAGFDVVAALEYDPVHAATHMYNFPQTEIVCRDVTKISGDLLLAAAERGFRRLYPRRAWTGHIDAIIGGPPCQGFSTGGKRLEGDERNDLLLEYVRIVTELRPQTICLENVAGLLERQFDGVRCIAMHKLEDAGYALSGTEGALNSLHFGVPQVRRRVIILGALGGAAPIQPVADANELLTVANAFEGLPPVEDYDALFETDEVRLSRRDIGRRRAIKGTYARRLAGVELMPADWSRPRIWSPEAITSSRRTAHQLQTVRRFGSTKPGTVEPKSRLYRLPLNGPSRTLRAGTGAERGAHTSPRPIHPTKNRVITVREAARLHGYPDWFRFHTTNWHGHRQVGNSVPPPLARAAAAALAESLGYAPSALRAAIPLGDAALLHLNRKEAQSTVHALDEELPATRTRIARLPGDRADQRSASR